MQNTSALKTFAQQTRVKLMGLVRTKLRYVLSADTAELRGQAAQIAKLREEIRQKGEDGVVEEVAYTWFNRIMALRYMDANNYNIPMVVTPAEGQIRPELLQEALGGIVDDSLGLTSEEKLLPEDQLYRRLLVAVCNQLNESMPFLFEHISDYTELLLPDDLLTEQSFVTDIRNGMTDEDCQQLQIVGWLYQFYITDRKKAAEDNKSRKGGLRSDEQAAATQLFTPDWIVRYMVENTLGKIWMTLHPKSPLRQQMKYYIDPVDSKDDPIPEHIKSVKDITFIDPCMGSGHVLIYAFILFAKMYEEEGYRQKDIPALIFENNLFGMDIDRRCYQLASFALTMTACRYLGRRYLRHTVAPKVIALQPISHDVIDATDPWQNDSLMWQFEHIDTIGSLLKVTPEDYENIHVHGGVFGDPEKVMKKEAGYLSRKYDCVVTNPPYLGKGMGDWVKEFCAKNYPIAKSDLYAAFILRALDLTECNGFTGLVTMESWMFLSSYEELRKHIIDKKYIVSLSHFDWHIMHIEFGTVSFIIQNIKDSSLVGTYSYLSRNDVDLKKDLPYSFPKKDNGRFNVISQNEFHKVPLLNFGYWASDNVLNNFTKGIIKDVGRPCKGIDTGDNSYFLKQWSEVNIIDIDTSQGKGKWVPYNKGGGFRKWYGFREFVLRWNGSSKELESRLSWSKQKPTLRNRQFWFKESFTWSSITAGDFSTRYCPSGAMFDNGGSSIFSDEHLILIGCLLNSKVAKVYLKILAPTLNYQPGDVGNVALPPIAFDKELIVKSLGQHNISISKLDWDAHETSWDFVENPLVAIMKAAKGQIAGKEAVSEIVSEPDTTSVTVRHNECRSETQAVSKRDTDSVKVGHDDYQSEIESLRNLCNSADGVHHHESTIEKSVEAFKALWTARFMQLHDNEEELNSEFIDIYGLQDELTPDVPLSEITILQQGEISIEED